MTHTDYDKETSRLKGAITRARRLLMKRETLVEKIKQKRVTKDAEEALRQHLLNRFTLIKN